MSIFKKYMEVLDPEADYESDYDIDPYEADIKAEPSQEYKDYQKSQEEGKIAAQQLQIMKSIEDLQKQVGPGRDVLADIAKLLGRRVKAAFDY